MTATLKIETFPNEAAADYIRGKAVADPKNFGKLPDQLKQRAFTVAGIEQLDTLRKLRDTISRLPAGANWDEVKKDLAAQLSPFIGSGDAEADARAAKARAEFMLRTHGFQAYAVGRHQQQMSVARDFPYWKYETVGDSRVRPGHAKLDGKVLRADDPWWKTHYPPWDWGCRCIVIALDEEDAQAIGVTPRGQMPSPERNGSYSFDASDAGISLDQVAARGNDADMRIFSAQASQVTVQADGRKPETMWELMVDGKVKKAADAIAAQTASDGNERVLVLDFNTGRRIGEVAVGDKGKVEFDIPQRKAFCTVHTHPNGDNTPSPKDMLTGFTTGSKVEYIAAGKKLRRWQWIKTPTPEDADILQAFNDSTQAGDFNRYAYDAFIMRLADEGYIKMEELS